MDYRNKILDKRKFMTVNRLNNNKKNLVPLCKKCHNFIHRMINQHWVIIYIKNADRIRNLIPKQLRRGRIHEA